MSTLFPESIRQQCAVRASERYKSKVSPEKPFKDVPCYQLPNGQLRPAYDYYNAAYPSEATPGLGTVSAWKEYYANDTHGYHYFVSDFRPLQETALNEPACLI